jgi:hypothetical protein
MKYVWRVILLAMLVIAIVDCTGMKIAAPTPVASESLTLFTLTPVQIPTMVPTPLPRWIEYERALARTFFYYPAGIIGHGICEWEVLGHSGQEIYVDAMCINLSNAYGSIMRSPAVILMGSNGDIESIKTPQPGNQYGEDVRKLFPEEVQQRLANPDYSADWRDHLDIRRNKGGQPLIVLLCTPMP